jgi:hypothetical protein
LDSGSNTAFAPAEVNNTIHANVALLTNGMELKNDYNSYTSNLALWSAPPWLVRSGASRSTAVLRVDAGRYEGNTSHGRYCHSDTPRYISGFQQRLPKHPCKMIITRGITVARRERALFARGERRQQLVDAAAGRDVARPPECAGPRGGAADARPRQPGLSAAARHTSCAESRRALCQHQWQSLWCRRKLLDTWAARLAGGLTGAAGWHPRRRAGS